MPLQHRHSYAVGIHRGLPTGETNRSKEFTARIVRLRVATQP